MLYALFMTGSVLFWALIAAHFLIMLALIEYEKPGWATFSLITVFAGLKFFGDFDIVKAMFGNLGWTAAAVAIYFVAGTAWAIAKWWFYVTKCRDKYNDAKIAFLERNGLGGATKDTAIPDELLRKWQETREHEIGYQARRAAHQPQREQIAPKARDHKGRIMVWMCYWPWSMVWTLINDPVKRLFKQIYLQIQGLLQSISNRAFAGVENDFREPPPAAPEEGVTRHVRDRTNLED
jgi:uncharacterized membrane protein YuzA (DUF378 family)